MLKALGCAALALFPLTSLCGVVRATKKNTTGETEKDKCLCKLKNAVKHGNESSQAICINNWALVAFKNDFFFFMK